MHFTCTTRRIAIAAVLFGFLAAAAPAGEDAVKPPEPRQIRRAIDHGLAWLVENQVKEGPHAGSWPSMHFRRAGASFAGLALLANGHRPGQGEAGETLDRAMRYVMEGMDANGWVGEQYESGMYLHAINSLFALSYLGRSPEPEMEEKLAAWCRKSLDLIIRAQRVRKAPHAQGGWRYTPTSVESDVSVTACVLQVLQAARQAGFDVEDRVFERAMDYIDNAYRVVEDEDGNVVAEGYVYRPGVSLMPEIAVNGVALYTKYLLEPVADEKARVALEHLRQNPPIWSGRPYRGYFFLGSFYISQGMFQVGGEAWDEYRPRIARILVDRQREDGRWPLPPDNAVQVHAIGPVYPTAVAVLILSLDKQYLPVYQRRRRLF